MAEQNFLNPRFGQGTAPADPLALDTVHRLGEVRTELKAQRAVLVHILQALATGRPPALHEEPLRTFLGLPAGCTPEAALERLNRMQARVLNTSRCPSCAAVLPDREGVHEERCIWCGATLSPRE